MTWILWGVHGRISFHHPMLPYLSLNGKWVDVLGSLEINWILTRCLLLLNSSSLFNVKGLEVKIPNLNPHQHFSGWKNVITYVYTQFNEWDEPAVRYTLSGWVWEIMIEIQDFMKITDQSRGIYRIYLKFAKEKTKRSERATSWTKK